VQVEIFGLIAKANGVEWVLESVSPTYSTVHYLPKDFDLRAVRQVTSEAPEVAAIRCSLHWR
jgi:hypothetical protein